MSAGLYHTVLACGFMQYISMSAGMYTPDWASGWRTRAMINSHAARFESGCRPQASAAAGSQHLRVRRLSRPARAASATSESVHIPRLGLGNKRRGVEIQENIGVEQVGIGECNLFSDRALKGGAARHALSPPQPWGANAACSACDKSSSSGGPCCARARFLCLVPTLCRAGLRGLNAQGLRS